MDLKDSVRHKRSRGPMSKWLLGKSTSKIASKCELGLFSRSFSSLKGTSSKKYELVPRDLNTFTKKSSPFGNVGYALEDSSCSSWVKWVNVFWSTKAKTDYEGEKMTIRENIMVQKVKPTMTNLTRLTRPN